MELKFFMLDEPPGKRVAKWKRAFGVREDGEVFVPAAVAGDELEVMLCAAHDGTPVASAHGHVYVPSMWVEKEFPGSVEVAQLMRERVQEMRAQGLLD